jgi:hypothetical protein
MKAKMALLIAATILLMLSTQACAPSPRWGYLANSGSPVPIKGTYFFTGEAWPNEPAYTMAPWPRRQGQNPPLQKPCAIPALHGLKTTFDVFTSVGPDNSLERLTERSVGLVTDQPSDIDELFVTLFE